MNDTLHPIFKDIVNSFIVPVCGECGEPFTVKEIGDYKRSGLDLYDKDTICTECFGKLMEEKDETASPFFCDDSKQMGD